MNAAANHVTMQAVVQFVHDAETFVHRWRPACANCDEIIGAGDIERRLPCGHAVHEECLLLHRATCFARGWPCACPACGDPLRPLPPRK